MSKHGKHPVSKSTPKAGGAPSPSIGKTGVTQSEQSTEGGQYPFLPPCSSYSGAKAHSVKSGPSVSTDHVKYPHLPNKPE